MSKRSSRIISRLLVVTTLVAMLLVAMLPVVSLAQENRSVSSVDISTTTGSTENLRYFKEDTYFDMSEKVNTPMTIEFELTGCGSIPGANPGGVIVSNYSEDASSYISVEVAEWGLLKVRGRYNSGAEWTASFYSGESADIRLNGVHHYTILINSGWGGVSLYVDGAHKATRYPASLTLPKASEYTHPFRIGGDYREGNSNYFKGVIYSVAMYSDVRTVSEIKADAQRAKTWGAGDDLMAAYDIEKMGVAALRDYSGNGNKLVYHNCSGIQVENFGKYEIDQALTSNIETFEAWVFMPKSFDKKAIGGTIVGNYRSYNGARVMLEVYLAGNPRLVYTNANGTTSYHRFTDVDLRTDTWQHLTVVHDVTSGEARCYVNGELKQTVTENVVSYSDKVLAQKFLIGRDTALRYAEGDGEYWENRADKYFKGFIKELRLYSDVRSADEIAADYRGSLDHSELIAAYQIDPDDAYSDLKDLSGNGYDANYKQLLWEKEYVELADDSYAYSLAIVGDTQTVIDQNPELLKNLYQWILDNQDDKNIQYVIGLGDITEYGVDVGHANYDEARANKQWTTAKEAITLMDGKIPYSLIRGDGHDGIELFNQYFASHEGYTNNIAGYYEEGRIDNVYHTFKVGDIDYLLLALDHGTKDHVLEWANEVVAAHPDHRVIVTTHQYLESDGTLSERDEDGDASAYDENNNAADELWDKFLRKHPNISMIICGHSDCDGVLVTKQTGDHGNEVTQVLIDPQGMDAEFYHGSKGMVAMLYFSEDGENVQVEYYSTFKGTYAKTSDFTVSVGEHSGEAVVENYVAPDCENTGSYESVVYCNGCGKELSRETKTVDALGHTAGEAKVENSVAPDCENAGSYENVVYCTVCNKELSRETKTVDALGHKYNAVVTDSTCVNAGYTTYTCTVCGYSYTADETDALGHTAGETKVENSVAPDCENAGSYENVTYCIVCGAETSRDAVSVPANGHSEETVDAVAPTCTETGLTEGKKCTVCGVDTVAQTVVPANGHSEKTLDAVAPTCTESGLTEGKKCTVCGVDTVAQKVVPANGHSDSDNNYICDVCEEKLCLDHQKETVPGYAPTCTKAGLTDGEKCAICGEILTAQKEIPATGHTAGATVVENSVAPTCENAGSYDNAVYCTVCGVELSRETVSVDALGHKYNAVVTDPTCVNAGYTTYTCTVCGDSYTADATDALGHTAGETKVENSVAPDCENAGSYDNAVYCTVCGVELSRDTVNVEALGHKYDAVVTAPDCVNGGYTTYTCFVCGDSYVADETEALGHDWEEATTEAPKTCKTCGETEGEKLPVDDPDADLNPDTDLSEKNHDECEASGELERLINFILNIIRRLFGIPEKCVCGEEL